MTPLRDYLCLDCGHEFEEFLSAGEHPVGCSHCESKRLERLPSAPGGYQIKGSNSASSRPKNAGSFKKAIKTTISAIVLTMVVSHSALAKPAHKVSKATLITAIRQSVDEVNKSVLKEFSSGRRHGLVPFRLLLAICTVESSMDPKAIHPHDGDGTSYGLCQIKEATAKQMGFEANTALLMNYNVNSFYAAKYLSHQLERYEDDWIKAIAAYNRGSSNNHISNQDYVNRVLVEAVKE